MHNWSCFDKVLKSHWLKNTSFTALQNNISVLVMLICRAHIGRITTSFLCPNTQHIYNWPLPSNGNRIHISRPDILSPYAPSPLSTTWYTFNRQKYFTHLYLMKHLTCNKRLQMCSVSWPITTLFPFLSYHPYNIHIPNKSPESLSLPLSLLDLSELTHSWSSPNLLSLTM